MSISFQPQTEEEVLNLLPVGVYDFQVNKAEDKLSKAGNPYIQLTLTVWDNNGRERFVIDRLMPQLMYKIKHFCDAVGLQDKYNAGAFSASDCEGRSGKCKLKIEESEGYAPKNAVQDYMKSQEQAKKDNGAPFEDDQLPF